MNKKIGGWRLVAVANRRASWIGLVGAVLVAIVNWRAWRRDRGIARELSRQVSKDRGLASNPTVSVLVAAWNEADVIVDHLKSLAGLSYASRELIICAGGSDGTEELARRFADASVAVLDQRPGEGKQRALRRCLEVAKGEVIVLTDADCLLNDRCFRRLLAPIIGGEEDVTTGTMRPLPRQIRLAFTRSRWFATLYVDSRRPPYSDGILGANVAIRRTALDAVGAFQPDVPSGTDYHLAKRLRANGYRIRFVPTSVVETRYPETVGEEARRQTRWLRNVVGYGIRFGAEDEVFRGLAPSVIGIAMILGPLCALRLGPAALVGWALALAHVLISRARYLAFARTVDDCPGGFRDLVLLPVFTLADFGVWAMALPRYLANGMRGSW